MEQGANPYVPNIDGETPYDWSQDTALADKFEVLLKQCKCTPEPPQPLTKASSTTSSLTVGQEDTPPELPPPPTLAAARDAEPVTPLPTNMQASNSSPGSSGGGVRGTSSPFVVVGSAAECTPTQPDTLSEAAAPEPGFLTVLPGQKPGASLEQVLERKRSSSGSFSPRRSGSGEILKAALGRNMHTTDI